MKWTLLDIVQDCLSDMDSDNVNSIMDTIESEQVAQIVKATYLAMVSNRDWPHLRRPIQISPYSDPSFPTHMTVQDEIKKLVSINYNKAKEGEDRKLYQPVKWAEPDHFLRLTNKENSTDSRVDIIVDPSGVELLIRNDTAPRFYTSFDDKTLVFNSYDKTVDDTLQSSKVQAQAYIMPPFYMQDDFVPDLPAHAFSALIEEVKSRAMAKLKQMQDPKSEQESRRQQRWLSRNDWRVQGGIRYPDYGRRTRKMQRDPTFERNDY
jgi:hypothetical protein